jgi:NADH dehydrogenase FAD-containing subunit
MTDRKKVVIIGSNFAGLSCAMNLSSHYAVTVIDASASFEFLPNIHELLSGVKSASLLRLPRARILHRLGHQFVQDTVSGIDAEGGAVSTASGENFNFDACVVAVGGVNNTYGLPGVDNFALPFKTVDDCARIRERLEKLAVAGRGMSLVIVGGGLEGVEALGEILRAYRHIPGLTVHLVEGSDSLLPGGAEALGSEILRKCQPYPVTFHFGDRVKAVTKTRVRLASGKSLKSDLTLWTGGAAPAPLLYESGLATSADTWAAVEPSLQSQVFDNVFVIGDAAGLPTSVSKQAYHALEMGSHAAANVKRFLARTPLRPFKSGPEISLISLGDIDTYLVLGQWVFAGPALAPAKELIFQANMARLDPPLRLPAALELQARYWQGIRELTVPLLWPPASLKRLANLRKIA